jgi:hypothetical protein
MKVFWAWQSDHPRAISRDVIRTALEEAIDQLKEERDVTEAPEESRGDLHLDHDTKGLTGSPDVARSILEKIQACTVFVGDVTLTQYFPNGEVWAVDTRLMKNGEREDESWYTVVSAEDMFISTLENGLKHFQQVGGEFPVKVSAGAVGLKGRRIVISGRALHMHGRMMTDEVHYTMLLQNGSLETQDKYLLGLFEKIFDQSGAPRPIGLNGFPKP